MNVVFDTGSDWLVIEGVDCETCLGNRYNPDTSAFFAERTSEIIDRTYGSIVHLKGKTVADEVCLTSGAVCVKPYSWFYVTE